MEGSFRTNYALISCLLLIQEQFYNKIVDSFMNHKTSALLIITLVVFVVLGDNCHPCYSKSANQNCYNQLDDSLDTHTLHMSVHPHLDAFWIFDFQSYYDPKPTESNVLSYFRSNRFNSVKEIFSTILRVLKESKEFRENGNFDSQKAHRSFFNSQMGFFKRWYSEQSQKDKQIVKQLLKTKYWEIVGGGYVEHDEGCAYYDDIIENFQVGLHFLKQQFDYQPKTAISADSFGHSQSTLAILAHLGVEGFFVERSDEHILKQNKTQFIWKAKSANGHSYGALPTHIRWAIHGFEDQFIPGGSLAQQTCSTKSRYIRNLNDENNFLKRILKSPHIMRYFGHDFQKFDEYSYYTIQGMMEQFSREKCNKVSAVYGNPSQYFMTLMGEVFGKAKPIATRTEDIMPIWDYDSGLYWTGYYTTDPFHKKNYRDAGRYLHAIRKGFLSSYISDPNSQEHEASYKTLQQFSEIVAYLQHHDGISGTSKYSVMDKYEHLAEEKLREIKKSVETELFEREFPEEINGNIFECSMDSQCEVPESAHGDVYLKIFNSGGQTRNFPIIVHLKQNQNYEPLNCQYYEINCLCTGFPCPCSLYIFTKISTYSVIKLKKVENRPKDANLMLEIQNNDNNLKFNSTHFTLIFNQKEYSIGYKSLDGNPTPRKYKHLTRYGTQSERTFSIRSGKYALGNDIKTQKDISKIRKVYRLESDFMKKYVIIWAREQMKTIITITNAKLNQWKIETFSAAQVGKLQDFYLEVSAPHIINNNQFYTDSNGWLVMKRELYKHEDYEAFFTPFGFDNIDGNSYPMTAFAYLQDVNNKEKISINTDRPQGVIAYYPGTLWVNFDRLSSDDGKWVYETTLRNEYQKFTHLITVQNTDNNERKIQRLYDEPVLIQGHQMSQSQSIDIPAQDQQKTQARLKWSAVSGLNNLKFTVKPWNDTTTLLRLHNLDDSKDNFAHIFSKNDKSSPFLTAYYGNMIHYEEIIETSLGGNMPYEEFLKKKWNWNQVVDLKEENKIFDKYFSERITLRPLEIRTFLFKGLKVGEQCKAVEEIMFSNEGKNFTIDLSKPMPMRSREERANQERINYYLLNGNHCSQPSPVLKNGSSVSLQAINEPQKQTNPVQIASPIIQEEIVSPVIQKVNNQQQESPIPIQSVQFEPEPSFNIQTQQKNDQKSLLTPMPENEHLRPAPEQSPQKFESEYQSIRVKVQNREVLTKNEKQKYFEKLIKAIKE